MSGVSRKFSRNQNKKGKVQREMLQKALGVRAEKPQENISFFVASADIIHRAMNGSCIQLFFDDDMNLTQWDIPEEKWLWQNDKLLLTQEASNGSTTIQNTLGVTPLTLLVSKGDNGTNGLVMFGEEDVVTKYRKFMVHLNNSFESYVRFSDPQATFSLNDNAKGLYTTH